MQSTGSIIFRVKKTNLIIQDQVEPAYKRKHVVIFPDPELSYST